MCCPKCEEEEDEDVARTCLSPGHQGRMGQSRHYSIRGGRDPALPRAERSPHLGPGGSSSRAEHSMVTWTPHDIMFTKQGGCDRMVLWGLKTEVLTEASAGVLRLLSRGFLMGNCDLSRGGCKPGAVMSGPPNRQSTIPGLATGWC